MSALRRAAAQRPRRAPGLREPDGYENGPEEDRSGIPERGGHGDAFAVEERSVLAAEVLERRSRAADRDPCVAPRDRGVVEKYLRLRVPPEDVLAVREHELMAVGDESDPAHADTPILRILRVRLARERVPESVDGAYGAVAAPFLAEGGAQLGDEVCEIRLDHERVGPESLVELGLGASPGPALEEEAEEMERLRGERDGTPRARELAALPVEHVVPDAKAHAAFPDNNKRIAQ